MTAFFATFFFALLIAACGLGVVRMLDPAPPSLRFRLVMRGLLLMLGVVIGLMAWVAWEMR